ncbi:MAG: SAM-dependent DNA methyltransferase [Verrucomicrobia bacterium]|nr:SAM-dependent DNA methyltransferase [Verrucomicrobiota bacterium]
MITGPLRSKIDKLWLEFFAGGITNPLTVIEQISFLMFARLVDVQETRREKMASKTGKNGSQRAFPADRQHLRWSHFRNESGDKMIAIVRDELFPFFREEVSKRTALGKYLEGAQCLVPKASLMVTAVNLIEELPLTQGDVKGDLYEYMLGKLSTAGIAGQFRTPRHIIAAMVQMLDPKPTEIVGDPACGTAGFLVEVMLYLLKKYTSEKMVWADEEGQKHYPGDLLEPHRDHIQNRMFNGFDFDQTMLRIAAMNLLLHDIESPCINYQDTLSNSFVEKYPAEAEDYFDVILANPPLKGSIDGDSVHASLRSKVKTTKTELLFLALIVRMLKMGGRAAVIVPDGVLFGSSNAHTGIRQMLVDENQLEAVISLPSGVFKPYAGVSTAILVFSKGGRTDNVWFYKVERDGYSLDDKRTKLPEDQSDLPDLVQHWAERDAKNKSDRSARHFFVPVKEIRDNKYDLSVNRYREVAHEEIDHIPPTELVADLKQLEQEIESGLDELEGMLT